MKSTGRRVYLSGSVRADTADKTFTDLPTGQTGYFEQIFQDERRGYAYKVTFAAIYPNVTNLLRFNGNAFGIYSFSKRELDRMTDAEAQAFLGGTRDLAYLNRNIAIVGYPGSKLDEAPTQYNLQSNYVIKGDAMVTQSLSLGVDNTTGGGAVCTYYIELEEYDISSDEEILLILNERAQDAQGIVDE